MIKIKNNTDSLRGNDVLPLGDWFFDKSSFNVIGYISFNLYTISKMWTHRNSEGWEKYEKHYEMKFCIFFPSNDDLYLSVSKLYNDLISCKSLSYAKMASILQDMDANLTVEETDIMVDCY